jgi:hypothetical protein
LSILTNCFITPDRKVNIFTPSCRSHKCIPFEWLFLWMITGRCDKSKTVILCFVWAQCSVVILFCCFNVLFFHARFFTDKCETKKGTNVVWVPFFFLSVYITARIYSFVSVIICILCVAILFGRMIPFFTHGQNNMNWATLAIDSNSPPPIWLPCGNALSCWMIRSGQCRS